MIERLIYLCIKGHILPVLAKSLNPEFCKTKTAAFESIRTSFQQLKWTAPFPLIWLIHEKSLKTVRTDIGNGSLHLFLFTPLLVMEDNRLYFLEWSEWIYLRAPGNTVSYWHVLAKGLPEKKKIFYSHSFFSSGQGCPHKFRKAFSSKDLKGAHQHATRLQQGRRLPGKHFFGWGKSMLIKWTARYCCSIYLPGMGKKWIQEAPKHKATQRTAHHLKLLREKGLCSRKSSSCL